MFRAKNSSDIMNIKYSAKRKLSSAEAIFWDTMRDAISQFQFNLFILYKFKSWKTSICVLKNNLANHIDQER